MPPHHLSRTWGSIEGKRIEIEIKYKGFEFTLAQTPDGFELIEKESGITGKGSMIEIAYNDFLNKCGAVTDA